MIYKLLPEAENDLDQILNYISFNLHNAKAAKDFLSEFMKVLNNLCLFPESAPYHESKALAHQQIRKTIVDNYVLCYFADYEQNCITVVYIKYGGSNLKKADSTINI